MNDSERVRTAQNIFWNSCSALEVSTPWKQDHPSANSLVLCTGPVDRDVPSHIAGSRKQGAILTSCMSLTQLLSWGIGETEHVL